MQAAERVLAKLTARRGERMLGVLTLLALVASAIMSLSAVAVSKLRAPNA